MKTGLHPENYRLVVFEDTSNGFRFITRSTASSDETTKWEDGNEYPLIKVHISSASHPFYTGEEKIVDVEGRVDRFKARAEAAKKKREALANKAKKQAKRSDAKEDDDAQKLGATPTPAPKKNEQKPAKKPKAEKPKKEEATPEPKEETKEKTKTPDDKVEAKEEPKGEAKTTELPKQETKEQDDK